MTTIAAAPPEFETIAWRMPLLVFHLEDPTDPRSLRFVAANPAAEEATGTRSEELAGQSILEAFPNLAGTPIPAALAEVVRTERGADLEEGGSPGARGGTGLGLSAFPLPDRCVGVVLHEVRRPLRGTEAVGDRHPRPGWRPAGARRNIPATGE
ncbi:MAG: PAS domain-containing protein [Gemmatimonadota bacterium]